jgi:hypothetical protein
MKHSIFCPVSKRSGILAVLFLLSFVIQLRAQSDTAGIPPQFLFARFDSGLVILKTGVTFNAVMNYNTLTEKMTFYKDAKLIDLNKAETVDTILLQNTKFVFIDNAFYEVLLNAPVSVFIQHKADLKSTGRPAALGTTSQTIGSTSVSKLVGENHTYNLKLPENFKVSQFPVYWVKLDYKFHRFLTVRQFLNIFPSKEDEIKQFINQNNLKISRPADLKKLGQFCNELIR